MNKMIGAVLVGLAVSLGAVTAVAIPQHAFFAAIAAEGQAASEGGVSWCKEAVRVHLILDDGAKSAGNADKQKMVAAKLRPFASLDCPIMKSFSVAVIENGATTNRFVFSAPEWLGNNPAPSPSQQLANTPIGTVPQAPTAEPPKVAASPALTMPPAMPEPPKVAATAPPAPAAVAPTTASVRPAGGCITLPDTIKDVPAGLCFEPGLNTAVALPPNFDNLIGYYPWDRTNFFDPWAWKRVPQFANAHNAFQGARGYLVVPTAGKATFRLEMSQNADWDFSCLGSLRIEGKKIIEFNGHSIPNTNVSFWQAETTEFEKPGLYKIEVGQNCDYSPPYDQKFKDRAVTWWPIFSLSIRQPDDEFLRPVGPTEIVRKVKVVQ